MLIAHTPSDVKGMSYLSELTITVLTMCGHLLDTIVCVLRSSNGVKMPSHVPNRVAYCERVCCGAGDVTSPMEDGHMTERLNLLTAVCHGDMPAMFDLCTGTSNGIL